MTGSIPLVPINKSDRVLFNDVCSSYQLFHQGDLDVQFVILLLDGFRDECVWWGFHALLPLNNQLLNSLLLALELFSQPVILNLVVTDGLINFIF